MKEWETTRIYIYEYMYNREQMYYNDLIWYNYRIMHKFLMLKLYICRFHNCIIYAIIVSR